MGMGPSFRPGMHGPSKPMQTTPTKTTSIHTVTKHKGVEKKKVNELHVIHSLNQEDRSLSLSDNIQGASAPGENNMSSVSPFSYKQIVDFGGIEEPTMQSVRSSGRLRAQPNYDATQLERAKMLLQKRDELPVIGMSKSQPSSLLSFSDEHIIDNAMALGVSLGNTFSEYLSSARLIKDFESQNTLIFL
jgi:hypothetical protein